MIKKQIFLFLVASIWVFGCSDLGIQDVERYAVKSVSDVPILDSDLKISFPADRMQIYQGGTPLISEDGGGGKKIATIKAGSSSEISIKYTLGADKTVYNVVAEENIGGGGGVNKTHFIPFDNSNAVKYILKTDTNFSVNILTVKPDEQFQNTSVFSADNYQPVTQPYKVRINLVGNKSEIFNTVEYWFKQGGNQRKNGYVVENTTISSEKSINTFLKDLQNTEQSGTYAPHVAIMNFGQVEAKAETFDAMIFETEYKALVSYIKSIKNDTRSNFTPKVILMSLDASVSNATTVNSSIKKVAELTGSVFFDIATTKRNAESIYNTKRKSALERASRLGFSYSCTLPNCQFHSGNGMTDYISRKLAEELFFSFYLDIEEIATPNQNISIAPTWKWAKTDASATTNADGNQDYTKRNLIKTVKAKGEVYYPQVIFTGDSITDFFDGNRYETANKDFWMTNIGYFDDGTIGMTGTSKKYRALNLGNGGDFTQSLLYRWQNISGDTASGAYTEAFEFSNSIKVISLLIGTNNIGPNNINTNAARRQERPISATETAKGHEEVIKLLKTEFPNAKIILMAVYPFGTNGQNVQYVDFTRLQIMALNKILYNKYGSGQDSSVIFVDTYEDYLKDCGCQFANYFFTESNDNIHPKAVAYKEIWWPTVQPVFDMYVIDDGGRIPEQQGRLVKATDFTKIFSSSASVDDSSGNVSFLGKSGVLFDPGVTRIQFTTLEQANKLAFIICGAKSPQTVGGSCNVRAIMIDFNSNAQSKWVVGNDGMTLTGAEAHGKTQAEINSFFGNGAGKVITATISERNVTFADNLGNIMVLTVPTGYDARFGFAGFLNTSNNTSYGGTFKNVRILD